MPDLLILAQNGGWESRFQVTSLAASAAAGGEQVAIALYFGALGAWVEEGWDLLDPAPPLTALRLEAFDYPPLSSLLEGGRRDGSIRVYACSASARFLDLDLGRVQAKVDAILGWQTFAQMISEANKVVTF